MKEWINLRKNNVYIVYSGPPRRIWARQGPTFYPNFFDQLFLIRAYWDQPLSALPAVLSSVTKTLIRPPPLFVCLFAYWESMLPPKV